MWPGRPFAALQLPSLPVFRGAGTNSGIILASLVTQVAVGDVNSVQRAYQGLGDCWGLEWVGESLYIEAVPLALRPFFATDTRSPAHYHERAPYGVCGSLALPTNSPDLWGQPCWLSALAR